MTWEQIAGEGDGKFCVAEVKKIIKIMEKVTRNDGSGSILEHILPGAWVRLGGNSTVTNLY